MLFPKICRYSKLWLTATLRVENVNYHILHLFCYNYALMTLRIEQELQRQENSKTNLFGPYPIGETRIIPLIPKNREEIINPKHTTAITYLTRHPHELTVEAVEPMEYLGLRYKDILGGYYIPEHIQPPAPDTKKLLLFFGQEDSNQLLYQTKNIIKTLFSPEPEAGKLVQNTLEFMERVYHEDKDDKGKSPRRNTKEPAICHETRVLLRTIADDLVYSYRLPPNSSQEDITSPANLWTYAAHLSSIILHDFKEDFILKGKGWLVQDIQDPRSILLYSPRSLEPTRLTFPHPQLAQTLIHLINAFTLKDYDKRYVTPAEAIQMQTEHLLYSAKPNHDGEWTQDEKFIFNTISEGKSNDRDDHLMTMWNFKRQPEDKYNIKLLETIYTFKALPFMAWNHKYSMSLPPPWAYNIFNRQTERFRRIPEPPRALGTAILKLLGADDNDLFGWITDASNPDNESIRTLYRAKHLNHSIIIPGPTKVDIIAIKGKKPVLYQIQKGRFSGQNGGYIRQGPR